MVLPEPQTLRRPRTRRRDQDAGRRRGRIFRASGVWLGGRRADLAGHLRASSGDEDDGQAARRVGYSVLVVNPFYRVGKPTATGATPIQEMLPFRKGMTPATDMSDAKTFVAWLDAQPQVNKNRKVGMQGYCMGGPMSFHTASAVPDRIGAVASFHGGGLVATKRTVPICWRPPRRPRSSSRLPRTTTSSGRTTRPS